MDSDTYITRVLFICFHLFFIINARIFILTPGSKYIAFWPSLFRLEISTLARLGIYYKECTRWWWWRKMFLPDNVGRHDTCLAIILPAITPQSAIVPPHPPWSAKTASANIYISQRAVGTFSQRTVGVGYVAATPTFNQGYLFFFFDNIYICAYVTVNEYCRVQKIQ